MDDSSCMMQTCPPPKEETQPPTTSDELVRSLHLIQAEKSERPRVECSTYSVVLDDRLLFQVQHVIDDSLLFRVQHVLDESLLFLLLHVKDVRHAYGVRLGSPRPIPYYFLF